jgi:hypothetical protein
VSLSKFLRKQANEKQPALFPICGANFSTMEGSFGLRAEAPFVFLETNMGHLTLREALASDRLEAFVRQEEARGVELIMGSDLERALVLLVTIRWSEKPKLASKPTANVGHRFEQA